MKPDALLVAAALALMAAAGAAQAQGDRVNGQGKPAPSAATSNAAQADTAPGANQTAAHPSTDPAALLTLSDAERTLVFESVDLQGDSTLALGFLTVGADVPRWIELKGFPRTVLDKVSKLKDYKYFSAEGRIAIVDPGHAKVQMVIEPRR